MFGFNVGLGLEAKVHFGAPDQRLAVSRDAHSDVVVSSWRLDDLHLVGPLCWTGRMAGVEYLGASAEYGFLWITLVRSLIPVI